MTTVTSEATTCVYATCPDCDDEVPLTVTVQVLTCDCWQRHQTLNTNVSLLDLEMHVLMHAEG